MVEIRVYGIPRPQGSKRHVGRGIMVEASKHVGQWRNDVMAAAAVTYKGPPITGPVRLEIVFLFPRPKSHFGTGRNADKLKASAPVHCISRAHGDTSKLIRSTEDAISASSGYPVIEDDSQVVRLVCEKRYVAQEEGCGAYIRVVESQYDSQRPSTNLRGNAEALVCQ
uniref:Endodeoxyribonuclease RusA n=1 Tax=uncultured organism MedDCM-OCT-S09-C20 TaxID=743645 RepID=D6PKY1_9ZZZZ|nr:endodeoxyribonuclease RusA [uncultured organism MedDCM-OCT-S09-C20]